MLLRLGKLNATLGACICCGDVGDPRRLVLQKIDIGWANGGFHLGNYTASQNVLKKIRLPILICDCLVRASFPFPAKSLKLRVTALVRQRIIETQHIHDSPDLQRKSVFDGYFDSL